MGVSYELDGNILEIHFEGRFSTGELIEAIGKGLSNERLSDPVYVLINASHSEELKPSDEIRTIAAAFGDMRSSLGPRLAVYVIHEVRFGLARILGVYLEKHGISCAPFYSRDEAVQWLKGGSPSIS